MDRVTRAKYYAELAHSGQTYNDEVPYSVHLGQVVDVLRRFGVSDDDIYCAAWLHDSIEDTRVSYNDIRDRFGEKVAELVFAVTNERGRNRKERNEKTYPKIFAAGENALVLKSMDSAMVLVSLICIARSSRNSARRSDLQFQKRELHHACGHIFNAY
jgi:(p)ppGpp synthase/HD superfamily hydrolase